MINLEKECKNLVDFKIQIDKDIQKLADQNKCRKPSALSAVSPIQFILKFLPFTSLNAYAKEHTVHVDPLLVIGGTYNDYSMFKVSKKYCEDINEKTNFASNIEIPKYYRIGHFPLYVASEGKNRVKLFRKFQVPISCHMGIYPYPKPNELLLHKVLFRKDIYYLSCSNATFGEEFKSNIFQLPYSEYTVPLLKKYGVEFGKTICKPLIKSINTKVFNFWIEQQLR